ncbi:MAG TPA: sigma-70 family RNA polymerase sigma factor [Polyangiaceae bacterium]
MSIFPFSRRSGDDDAPTSGVVSRPASTAERDARLRAMVASHFEFIWRSLRGLGVPQGSVDDAAQQVFWIASQKLDAIQSGSERAFLFSTARGVAANARRARTRSRETDDAPLATMADAAPNPEQAAQRSQAKRVLERVLSEMDEDTRTVFVLFELEGLTSNEIAELLSIPVGTAASRLRRAREEFQLAVTKLQLRRGAP